MKTTSTQSFISVYTVHVTGPQIPEKVWKSARMCTNPVSHIYTVHFIHIHTRVNHHPSLTPVHGVLHENKTSPIWLALHCLHALTTNKK